MQESMDDCQRDVRLSICELRALVPRYTHDISISGLHKGSSEWVIGESVSRVIIGRQNRRYWRQYVMSDQVLKVPRSLRRGGRLEESERSVRDTLKIIALVCRNLGIDNLAESRILDMGCGYRMAKSIIEQDILIKEYVGLDVFRDMIEFLREEVNDPRFNFHSLDIHNEMYNPQGKPLAELGALPISKESFDIIWLFSVFTHLAPHDYSEMLKLLRPYVRPEGRLVFSLFVNEVTPSGLGFISSVNKKFEEQAKENTQIFMDKFSEAYNHEHATAPPFVDFDPTQPLKWAIYSREHALELVQGTGWEVESLNDPEDAIQHYMICRPV